MQKFRSPTCSQTFLVVLLVAGPLSSIADAQDVDTLQRRISRLEQEVKDLRARVSELEQAVAATRPEGNATKPLQKAAQERLGSSQGSGWKVPSNWDRVQHGMSERQVISILGQPTSVEQFVGYRTLFYRGEVRSSGFVSGNIKLSDDRVLIIEKPVF